MGKEKENRNGKTKGNAIALMPIGVFLVLYLGLGILFEYVMKIPMGFYKCADRGCFSGSDPGCLSAEQGGKF